MNQANFNQMTLELMKQLDQELTSKMVLRTATKEEVFVFLLELGRLKGFDLARGSKAFIHPDNLPIGYKYTSGDSIIPSPQVKTVEILFVGKVS